VAAPAGPPVRVEVAATRARLLAQEDTDGDRRITVEDHGPRRFRVAGLDGGAFEVAGTLRLASLLEELTLAAERGEETALLAPERLFENPVVRLSRRIREELWDNLTRRVDAEGLGALAADSKAAGDRPRLYVPHGDAVALAHFREAAAGRPELEVVRLPERITPEYVRGLNRRPGILSLALREEEGRLRGVPFVVPGGRFNEMYGWDSYFEALGLLVDGRVDLARAMVDNFVYQLGHYGRILNANRSYYLTRSQPPFLTAMARAVYAHLPEGEASRQWLATALAAAIREYETVWTSPPRLTETGLSRYYGEGLGPPPETEPGHFAAVLAPFAADRAMAPAEYEARLRAGEIDEPELAAYFVHDRAVRESGHDTSYRLEGRCADLVTVDLNSLLYRYETDLAEAIEEVFGGELVDASGRGHRPDAWRARAEERRQRMEELLWEPERGWFFDYDFRTGKRTGYESATALYPLWAGWASPAQAEALVARALPALEAAGGLLAGTESSRGPVGLDRPQRQWDYPSGWAPHQMLAWEGLARHGYAEEARRLAGRWLYTLTRNAADYNGTVPEKYDVVARSHKVFAEYGNVGTDFAYITREGFGWMNASYQVGLALLDAPRRRRLEELIPPEWHDGPAPAR
jgi:alpha,alpha-trehalase